LMVAVVVVVVVGSLFFGTQTFVEHLQAPILRGAWVPPLEDGACHDEHLYAPIFRGAWVPPLEDGACHDETPSTIIGGEVGGGGRSVAHSYRAVIGWRGSLLPRRFDTSESRGARADLTAAVGRSWSVGLAPLGARVRKASR